MRKVSNRIIIVVAFLFASIGSYAATRADKTDFTELRQRICNSLLGTPFDSENAMIEEAVGKMSVKAEKLWREMSIKDDGSYPWPELASKSSSTEVYRRILSLAIALKTPGSSLYENPELKNDLVRTLDILQKYFYNTDMPNDRRNWWELRVGIPTALNNTILLMYDDIPHETVTKYMDAVIHFNPDIYNHNKNMNYESVNLTWILYVLGTRGIILQDDAPIGYASKTLLPEIKFVEKGDGFYKDGSYLHHNELPYNVSYGLGFLSTIIDMMKLFEGTQYEIPAEYKGIVLSWIYNSFEPLCIFGALSDTTRGRAATRANRDDESICRNFVISLIKFRDYLEKEDKDRIDGIIRYNLSLKDDPFDGYTSLSDIVEVDRFLKTSHAPARKNYVIYKQFPAMDRMIYQNPDWAFGVNMHSTRILDYETNITENLKGWHTGSGMTFYYDKSGSTYGKNYWPTVNYHRIPGTTVPEEARNRPKMHTESPWTGGTAYLDRYGVSGMFFDVRHNPMLQMKAKKSWFVFDDEIVCMGSDISSETEENNICTTIEQRLLSKENNEIFTLDGKRIEPATGSDMPAAYNDVQWAHLSNGKTSGIGYFFPGGMDIKMERRLQEGRWKDINKGQGNINGLEKNYFLTMWKEHGNIRENIEDDANKYVYCILPVRTKKSTRKYVKNPDIVILENSSAIHAVHEKSLDLTAANFWEDNEDQAIEYNGEKISCNRKASMMFGIDGDTATLAISDPTQLNNSTITVTFKKLCGIGIIEKPENMKIVSLSPLKVEINVAGLKGISSTLQVKIK